MNSARFFGSGGTGGTKLSSGASPDTESAAILSRADAASPELERSLPALLRLALALITTPAECLPDAEPGVEREAEAAETDVALVPIDSVAESRELVVGVLVYVPDDAEPRLGEVRAERVIEPDFLSGLSSAGEPRWWVDASSLL